MTGSGHGAIVAFGMSLDHLKGVSLDEMMSW